MRIRWVSPADPSFFLPVRVFSLQGFTVSLFGLSCPLCRAFVRTGTPLCIRCLATFERETRHCPDERANVDDYIVQGMFRYEGIAREMFGLAKFGGNRALADFLIERGIMRLAYPSDVHLWVPVPPERTRLLVRGFSLPDRMAWRIGMLTGIPCAIDGSSLHAEKEQKKLDRPGRLSERLHREWSGGRFSPHHRSGVAILDDLVTTGGTIRSFATFLRKKGARIVRAITLFDAPLRVERES